MSVWKNIPSVGVLAKGLKINVKGMTITLCLTCVSVSAGILKQEEAVLTRRGLGQSKTALVGVQRCILALVAVPTPTPHAPVPWR